MKFVDFCVAILIMKMEENKQYIWYVMFYYLKKVKNAGGTQKTIYVLSGESAVTDWMCQKWFVKFLGTIDILAK